MRDYYIYICVTHIPLSLMEEDWLKISSAIEQTIQEGGAWRKRTNGEIYTVGNIKQLFAPSAFN